MAKSDGKVLKRGRTSEAVALRGGGELAMKASSGAEPREEGGAGYRTL